MAKTESPMEVVELRHRVGRRYDELNGIAQFPSLRSDFAENDMTHTLGFSLNRYFSQLHIFFPSCANKT
jgi:hypothetical protein